MTLCSMPDSPYLRLDHTLATQLLFIYDNFNKEINLSASIG
jgi:hypothetical protein